MYLLKNVTLLALVLAPQEISFKNEIPLFMCVKKKATKSASLPSLKLTDLVR